VTGGDWGPALPTFTPPYAERQHSEEHLRFKSRYGISVLRIGGQWLQQENPSAEQITAADRYYPGGHVHTITDAEKSDLIAAGYGAYITG
jgi:hypothetical protein